MSRAPRGRDRAATPRLSLGDPLDAPAAEDTAEAWGERGESDSDRWNRYEAERPPHHGD